MARAAVLALTLLVAALWWLARIPSDAPDLPEDRILLTLATVRLYPAADPDAVWRFVASNAAYDANSGETELFDLHDGERRVGDSVDFTIVAPALAIQRDDDLRSDRIEVHLLEDGLNAVMQGRDGRLVRVAQRDGRFEVPDLTMAGDGVVASRYQNVLVDFDFNDFQAGGPNTIGFAEFELDAPAERNQERP